MEQSAHPAGELRTLQAWRAAACLMVVIYHCVQAGAGEAAITAWPNGSAGVDLFFVISGFVMVRSGAALAPRADGARAFLRRRLRRIVPLYWLMTGARLALVSAAPSLAIHAAPDAWNIVGSLAFIPVRDAAGLVRPVLSVGWTLDFEMLFYVLFAAALAARVRPLWITPVLATLALAGFWRGPSWPAPLMLANGLVLEFAAGMAIATLRPAVPRPLAAALLGMAMLLVAPLCGPWRFLAWGGPAALVVAALVGLEQRLGPAVPRLALSAGEASFATYLAHPFVVAALAPLGLPGACAAVPVSFLAGAALHRFLDAPMQRMLHRPGRPRAGWDVPSPPDPPSFTGLRLND